SALMPPDQRRRFGIMLVEVHPGPVEALRGVAIRAAEETRVIHANVPAHDTAARRALGGVLLPRYLETKRLVDHFIIHALAGPDAVGLQVDRLGTTDDVQAVRAGHPG